MTGNHSVEKIGGTSMAATATLFDNVLIRGRSGEDLYNRIFVVSAYAGMTDLLLEHKKSGEPGVYARFLRGDGEWREALERVSVQRVAMVAAIGSDISEPGLVPRALAALEDAGVPMIAIQHQIRNVDVQFIVAREDFQPAIKALHAALVEKAPLAGTGRAAA